jgi:hypothetical protein
MQVKDVSQAMEVAKMMSISGSAVPPHIRNNPGTCLAVAIQAWEWSMNPFAVANKSYVVNDRLAYEASLYNAVATRRAPIVGRVQMAYSGEGATRRCTVSATLKESEGGGVVEYTSPLVSQINPKNSPLWKNDPDQQLSYFSVRAFVRRHFPDVMMGVYTVDEMQDTTILPVEARVVDTGGKVKKFAFAGQPSSEAAVDMEQPATPENVPTSDPLADLVEMLRSSTEADPSIIQKAISEATPDGEGLYDIDAIEAQIKELSAPAGGTKKGKLFNS